MWIAGQVCLEGRVCFSHPGLGWLPCAVPHAQPWWVCAEGHLMGGHGKAGTPGVCRAEMCPGEDTWGDSARSWAPFS